MREKEIIKVSIIGIIANIFLAAFPIFVAVFLSPLYFLVLHSFQKKILQDNTHNNKH